FDRLIAIDPATGEASSVSVPGFDQRLTNPINEFDSRFGKWTRSPGGTAPRNPDQLPVFDTSAPAVPFVMPAEAAATNGHAPFSDRFGSWPSSPEVTAPSGFDQPTSSPRPGSSMQTDPRDIRVLRPIDGKSNVFDSGAPTVAFAAENSISGQGRPASFDDRFGSWPSTPAGVSIGSYQRQTASTQPDDSTPPTDPRDIRVLRRTVVPA